mmetsp:Transcript_37588/g.96999  ORF Transcript_37588/g.96999 Transcript_37588/m.96999 type:complete len:406 (-) Transcript_37588:156-1373(-)
MGSVEDSPPHTADAFYHATLQQNVSRREDHYCYVISVVSPNGEKLQVQRRYSEFLSLHRFVRLDLQSSGLKVSLPSLPRKKSIRLALRLVSKEEVALSRVEALNSYLEELLRMPALQASSRLRSFLEDGAKPEQGVIASPSPARHPRHQHALSQLSHVEMVHLSILVIGEAASGKTCLIHRMVKKKFLANPPAGRGADLRTMQLSTVGGDPVHINFYDLPADQGFDPIYLPQKVQEAGVLVCIPFAKAMKMPVILSRWLNMISRRMSTRRKRNLRREDTYVSSSDDDSVSIARTRPTESESGDDKLQIPCIVAFTKVDSGKKSLDKEFSSTEIAAMEENLRGTCRRYGALTSVRTSSKTGENVDSILGMLVGVVMRQMGMAQTDIGEERASSARSRQFCSCFSSP